MDPRGSPPQTSSFLWPQFLLSEPVTWISRITPNLLHSTSAPPLSIKEHPPPFSVPAQTPSQPKSHKVTQFPALALYDMTAGAKIVFEFKNTIFCNKSSCRHPSFSYCCGASSNTLEVNISLKIIIILFLRHKNHF